MAPAFPGELKAHPGPYSSYLQLLAVVETGMLLRLHLSKSPLPYILLLNAWRNHFLPVETQTSLKVLEPVRRQKIKYLWSRCHFLGRGLSPLLSTSPSKASILHSQNKQPEAEK